MATQCLLMKKSKAMQVLVEGALGRGVTAKDIALAVIGKIGTAGGTGYAIEFAGSTIRGLSMEGRMTLCNMAIEAGARAGMIAADDTTINYLKGRPFAPQGELWDKAVAYWHTLHSDEGAQFDQVVESGRRADQAASDLGHVAGNGGGGGRARARSGDHERCGQA